MMKAIRTIGTRALVVLAAAAAGCGAAGTARDGLGAAGPDSTYRFHRSLAVAMLQGRHTERALPHIQEMATARPKAAEPRYLTGYAFVQLGGWKEARGQLEQALKAEPDYAAAHALLGIVLDSIGQHVAAEVHHRAAIRLDEGNAAYRNNLGFGLYLQGRWADAQAAFLAALDRAPDLRKARINLGFACGRAGDIDAARQFFQLAGRESEALNNLGYAHELRGDLDAARTAYGHALELEPDLAVARDNLARVAARKEDAK